MILKLSLIGNEENNKKLDKIYFEFQKGIQNNKKIKTNKPMKILKSAYKGLINLISVPLFIILAINLLLIYLLELIKGGTNPKDNRELKKGVKIIWLYQLIKVFVRHGLLFICKAALVSSCTVFFRNFHPIYKFPVITDCYRQKFSDVFA